MKRLPKIFVGFVTMVSMVLFSPTGSYAASISPVHGKKYTRGITRVSIYIDSSSYPRASYWEPRITEAVENWRYTNYGGNQFDRVYVSSSVASQMDWHAAYNGYWGVSDDEIVIASTTRYDSEGVAVDPRYQDWYYAKIVLNDDYLRQDSVSNKEAVATMTHEMGHAFGLAENNGNKYSIMCQVKAGRAVYTVQKPDNDALNSLYY